MPQKSKYVMMLDEKLARLYSVSWKSSLMEIEMWRIAKEALVASPASPPCHRGEVRGLRSSRVEAKFGHGTRRVLHTAFPESKIRRLGAGTGNVKNDLHEDDRESS
jgi:hypothetical protein